MAIYGIDLGTTNSLIGLYKTGFLSDLVPSCVDMGTGAAGKDYYDNMSAVRSFKVDMSMGTEGIIPRIASQHVLEELCRQVPGGDVKDVVISVPAYFSDSQRTATITAAKEAGLNVRGLVNEPTAAAMYIAQNKKSLFVVFDLGGGTFDVSIIDSRFGTYDVQATSGIVVGGDNFDKNIMRHFIKEGKVPVHRISKEVRMKLQHFASKQKVEMQIRRTPFEIDLSEFGGESFMFTPSNYIALMQMTFSSAITCMKSLIDKWIPSTEYYEILLVGGSTHCPYLQDWVKSVTNHDVAALTYDPDRVVAQGAALYADMVENGLITTKVSDVTKALSIGLYDGTVETIIEENSKIPLSAEKLFTNPTDATSLILDLYQGNSLLASDNELIGQLVWDYGECKATGTGQVIVNVDIDTSGVITFSAHELLREPKVVVLKR